MDLLDKHLGRILVISPHLDDGVFSCAELLAAHPGSMVLTIFAGVPDEFDELTDWDAACGFASARQAIATRRAEDRAALDLLHAEPCWLDFCDSQYRRDNYHAESGTGAVDEIATRLRDALHESRAQTILVPCGLFHDDHRLAHAATLPVLRDAPQNNWLAYEEAQYRRVPGTLQQRLAALAVAGVTATPIDVPLHRGAQTKREAVHRYASQLRGLSTPGRPGYLDVFAPERYWRLTPGLHGHG